MQHFILLLLGLLFYTGLSAQTCGYIVTNPITGARDCLGWVIDGLERVDVAHLPPVSSTGKAFHVVDGLTAVDCAIGGGSNHVICGPNSTGGEYIALGSSVDPSVVIGPVSNHDSYIPQWNGANSKTLADGLEVVTTVGNPGVDTAVPTEKAVRNAISAAGLTPATYYKWGLTGGSGASFTANNTRVFAFYVRQPISFSKLAINVTTADTGTGSTMCPDIATGTDHASSYCYDLGIYSPLGALIAHTGPKYLSATGVYDVAVSAISSTYCAAGICTMPAGWYHLGISAQAGASAARFGQDGTNNYEMLPYSGGGVPVGPAPDAGGNSPASLSSVPAVSWGRASPVWFALHQ